MARTSRLTLLIFLFDFKIDECLWTLALPITFKAKVSGLSAFRHSTTVENSPSPNLLSTSYGPTHVSVSSLSAATDGGRASCWAQVLSKSVGLPVACSARGRIFFNMLDMLGSR